MGIPKNPRLPRLPTGQYTAELYKMIPALRVPIRQKPLKLSTPAGPEGRLKHMGTLVTDLVREERIKKNFYILSEARNYAERLISEAIRHGDRHQPTMELADFWLKDKTLVHKLFKVLVPRFRDSTVSYTKMYKAPIEYPGSMHPFGILELRKNPLLPVAPRPVPTRNWIHNVLLEEARKQMKLEGKLRAEEELQEQVQADLLRQDGEEHRDEEID